MTDSSPNSPARQFPLTPPSFDPPPPPPGAADLSIPGSPALPVLYDHDPSSRELLLGWCFWLLGSWFVLGLGLDGTPVRWMIYTSMIGMLILWPLYRLSQDGFLSPRRRWKWYEPPAGASSAATKETHRELEWEEAKPEQAARPRVTRSRLTPWLILRDWFALNVVFQAIVWPHLLTDRWTTEQALWVNGVVAAWSLLIGAIVAWGCQAAGGVLRGLAMFLVLAVLFLEPVAMGVMNQISEMNALPDAAWQMRISPIEAIHVVTQPMEKFYIDPWIAPIVCVGLAAILAWAGLLWRTRRRIPLPPREGPGEGRANGTR